MSDFDRVFLEGRTFVPSRGDAAEAGGFHDSSEDPSPASGREGLPPTFRMRHDKHYVDLIASRPAAPPVHLIPVRDIDGARPFDGPDLGLLVDSIAAVGIVQPLLVRRRRGRYELIAGSKRLAAAIAAGLTEVPCLLREADDERARALAEAENLRFEREEDRRRSAEEEASLPARAAREIIDSLATIESCLNLFLDRERPLRERVAANLVRAEAHRARWLAEAYGLLGADPVLALKALSPAALVGRTIEGLESEGRLANVELAVTIDEPACTAVADDRLMSLALAGAAGAMIGLPQGTGVATLRFRVSSHPATGVVAFQLSRDLAAGPELRASSPACLDLPDWPGGHGASLGIAVATRVMQLHGGQIEIGPGPRGGCTLTLFLPAGS